MRIQHNIMAMNAYRNYNNNTKALSGNLEKLSSGYKINRAGDDAAGLAISEKMRAQITGLDAAQKNVKDGISLVKTAEGAMQEIQDMLNRMDYLATQSANGTYDNETDRANLQKEVDALRDEIDRIADSANFNGIKLLDGSWAKLGDVTDTAAADASFEGMEDLEIFDAGTTQGSTTITHSASKDAKQTTFEVDLSNVNFRGSTGIAAAGSTVKATVTLDVGGAKLTAGIASIATSGLKSGQEISAASLAASFASSVSSSADKKVTIGGVGYTVTNEGNKLKFTMTTTSAASNTDAAKFTGSFEVKIEAAAGTTVGAIEGDTDFQTSNIVTGNPRDPGKLADTGIKTALTADDIKDGAGIRVGNEAYVFALTQDTLDAVKDMKITLKDGTEVAVKAVDLTDLAKTDGSGLNTDKYSDALRQAMERLTETADSNEMFSVQHGTDSAVGALHFREQVDYHKQDGHIDFSDVKTIQSQIQKFDGVNQKVTGTTKNNTKTLNLQIGDTSDDFNQLKVNIGDMHVDAMYAAQRDADGNVVTDKDGNIVYDKTKSIDNINIANQDDAAEAVQVIKDAINYVSSVRGDLGAVQNRLDHTANNLSVMAENIQDAESTIRDTDVADEMMKYVKNNILVQSAQAMLAQANQVPQGVLQLLG